VVSRSFNVGPKVPPSWPRKVRGSMVTTFTVHCPLLALEPSQPAYQDRDENPTAFSAATAASAASLDG